MKINYISHCHFFFWHNCMWCNSLCHHTAESLGALSGNSRCLHCVRLFQLNWRFCNTTLSDRSGRRITTRLGQREAHYGRTEPEVGWRWGRVKGHCRRATAEAHSCRVKSIRVNTKRALFFSVCILALCCLFTLLHGRGPGCLLKNSADTGLSLSRNQHTGGVNRAWRPHYVPIVLLPWHQ